MTFGHGGFGRQMGGGAPGLPFAGIPSEYHDAVTTLLENEPDHGTPTAVFNHAKADPDGKRLNLRRLLTKYWRMLILASVLVVIETLTLQTGPKLTQIGIDDGISKHNFTVVVVVAVLYLLSVAATGFASAARVGVTGRIAARVMNDLRVKVFTQLQRLSLDFFTEEKAGVIMTRMTSDIENLQQLLQDGLVQFAIQGLTMVVVTAVLFTLNPGLALITVVMIIPILTVLSLWFRKASDNGYTRVRDAIAAVLADLSESLQGVRIVAAYNRQLHNIKAHREITGRYRDANNYTALVNAIYAPSTQVIGLLGQLVLLAIGTGMVLSNQLSVGELVAFLLYLGAFFQPIQQLVQLYNTYQQGQSSVRKLRTLLSTEPSVLEKPEAIDLPPINGAITFSDVSFGYSPGTSVIHDVNLDIQSGETIAFVGPTGAGKSTLAKLVTRFYDPTAGRILIDSYDLSDVTLESLRKQLGVVPQEPFLFAGTVADNVRFARPDSSDDEVWTALRAVGLAEVVERMPQQLNTSVHERGQSLSSGERQLIALARAFLAQPRVLVLDEATSNLDLQSEQKIEAALDVLLESRTALLIAHRLSTAMKAHRIVVVDDGRIVEVGSHAELVAAGGRYSQMYATWVSHAQ